MPRKRKEQPMLDAITVDNSAEYAERTVHPKISAVRTLRDDPIGQMHARGQLGPRDRNPADARLDAARRFQATWEAAGHGTLRSPDMLASGRTDPSRRSGVTDRSLAASRQLAAWRVKLGQSGYDLLVLVLIDKRTVNEAARARHGIATRAAIMYTGNRLKECLDII
jgi:hypothetical protein